MITYIALVFWVGGLIPAYRHSRNNGNWVLSACVDAVWWPGDVGWNLALKHCKDQKE